MIGSSPRARGTRIWRRRFFCCSRFIPAGAGNTPGVAVVVFYTSVHPRGRGEHNHTSDPTHATTGSSPRARGTQVGPLGDSELHRFIPAGAGNTCSPSAASRAATVHPRGRGEHLIFELYGLHSNGSSPRARGTQVQVRLAVNAVRFIPAGAGNTILPSFSSSATCGSSPRARGTPFLAN